MVSSGVDGVKGEGSCQKKESVGLLWLNSLVKQS